MGGKSCFFIGHRETSEEIYPALYAAVEQHILEYGVTEFIVGHYGGFDRLAASAVKEARRFYPEVKLTLLLPYHPAERPIPTPDGFDGTFYPPGIERSAQGCNREGKSLCCGSCRLPDCLCLAPRQQRAGAVEYAQKRQRKNGIQITVLTQVAI